MRTTIDINETLLEKTKKKAKEKGKTLSQIIEESLQLNLQNSNTSKKHRKKFRLITAKGEPGYTQVNLNKTSRILAGLEEEDFKSL